MRVFVSTGKRYPKPPQKLLRAISFLPISGLDWCGHRWFPITSTGSSPNPLTWKLPEGLRWNQVLFHGCWELPCWKLPQTLGPNQKCLWSLPFFGGFPAQRDHRFFGQRCSPFGKRQTLLALQLERHDKSKPFRCIPKALNTS